MLKSFKKEQLDQIGFSFLFEELKPYTPYGIEKKKQIEFFPKDNTNELLLEYIHIEKFFNLYSTQKKIAQEYEELLKNFKQISGILKKISNYNAYLDDVELFEIKNFVIDIDKLYSFTNKNNMASIFSFKELTLKNQQNILKLLNPQSIINRSFYIYESYSDILSDIREKKKITNDLKERQHIVELEKEEEEKIRKDLTRIILENISDFYNNIDYLKTFDFCMAKARLAIKFDGIEPKIDKSANINVLKIRNPMMEAVLKERNKLFTPVDIELSKGSNILTGANMGGKTVALNTLALNVILALSGFFVYATDFTMPHLDYLFFLSQDLQSFQRGLSTFGAQIVEIKKLIDDMKSKVGLAILDEFARGTNPEEATIIINGFLSYVQKHTSFCLLSTHYSNIGTNIMKHFQVNGLKNADFEKMKYLIENNKTSSFDVIQDFMDYSLQTVEYDCKPPQEAIKVAILMGLSEEFFQNINRS